MRSSVPGPALAVAAAATEPDRAAESAITLDDAAVVWRRDLRQTLIEPPKKEEKAPEPPPPPPQVELPRLVATFVENGKAWGIFVSRKGGHVVRSESAQLDDFTIAAIRPGEAVLMRQHREYTVRIPKIKQKEKKRRSRRRGY